MRKILQKMVKKLVNLQILCLAYSCPASIVGLSPIDNFSYTRSQFKHDSCSSILKRHRVVQDQWIISFREEKSASEERNISFRGEEYQLQRRGISASGRGISASGERNISASGERNISASEERNISASEKRNISDSE